MIYSMIMEAIQMIKVAVLGFGTVGSGVVETIDKNCEIIRQKTGKEISVKYIVDVRDFPDSPYKELVVHDFAAVENDDEISIVVETIGGVKVAYDFTKRALSAGKSVVTSNKELVATHGCELMDIARTRGVSYMFEASVGGGMPIIRPLMNCLAADDVLEVFGILNGTTNFILTQMFKNGVSFSAALAKAQELGYSELNPTADIDGIDACRKVSILASLITGVYIAPEQIPAEGISGVSINDVEAAAAMGYTIKLIGRTLKSDGKMYSYVAPHLIKNTNLLSSVEGVMNGITVHGNIVGEVMFYGPGAGKMPTASAVVADIVDIAKDARAGALTEWKASDEDITGDPQTLVSPWFIRTSCEPEAMRKIIPGIKPVLNKDDKYSYYVGEMSKTDLMKALDGVNVLSAFRVID